MEKQIEALLEAHPHLDYLLAETLLLAHENGTLPKTFTPADATPKTTVVPNAITVEAGD